MLLLAVLVIGGTASSSLAGACCKSTSGGKAGVKGKTAPETAAAEEFDIAVLKARLQSAAKAMSFFRKLALKNQLDDLMDRFRRFHEEKGNASLEDMRERFDLLFMKVITLLQNCDPKLFRDVDRVREILWNKLADPRSFAQLRLADHRRSHALNGGP